MKKTSVLAICLIISTLSFGQAIKNEAIIKAINALELQRFEAQVKKDYVALDKILSNDLIYTHSSGKVDSKESYIQSIKDGKSVYESIESEEMKTKVLGGHTAIISGTCRIKLGGATPSEVHLRYTDVYVKDKVKGWQMASWQSLKLVEPAK
jgi:chaperonin GroEL (HSP60 family)